LSGLLNFIDGLWSSCGDERIIVFTTNYKDKLDPALLRPGRMDMHIHMSYCTPCGFKILASNYLNVKEHSLCSEIDELIMETEVTPAEVAEELMKNEDVDTTLTGLIGFLERKKVMKGKHPDVQKQKEVDENQKENDNKNESLDMEEKCEKKKAEPSRRKRARKPKGRT
jgi:chaperone BCS1